jgi:methionyl-tRNA formyltransferase
VKSAVVFAYHDVGVRCLKTLLARGIHVSRVITHQDDPRETIWFQSVQETARQYQIEVVTPEAGELASLVEQLAPLAPDFLFSFYYRFMLPEALLKLPPMGAYNMHGSLLPRYRGRVPVNWAVLNGETETGATLHEMTSKPDAGAIVDQQSVPILPDDTAADVFGKVVVAAEQTLWRALPGLIAGSKQRIPNRLEQGSYFGGRRAEDGRIDWSLPRKQIYNLIRAVAPPYPGAFTVLGDDRLVIDAAWPVEQPSACPAGLLVQDNQLFGVCGDGLALKLTRWHLNGQALQPDALVGILHNQ